MQAEYALRAAPPDEGLGRAVVLALALHVLLAALLWLSSFFSWEREVPAAAGLPVMNADLAVSDSEAAAAREALAFEPEPLPEPEDAVPPPQPLPEPVPDESPVERQLQAQERVPVPDTEQQDEVREDAVSEEMREREQEEKRRQEQVDLTEDIERQRQAEQRQRLARQQELQRIREELRKAERQTEMHEQRLRQLADARAQSASEAAAQADAAATGGQPGNQGVDNDLLGRYQAALIQAIRSKWTRPDSVPLGQRCRINITQLPGGEVMSVSVSPSCPYDEAGRRSVEAAVLKAQPLPYAGFESVFQRNLNLNFEAAD